MPPETSSQASEPKPAPSTISKPKSDTQPYKSNPFVTAWIAAKGLFEDHGPALTSLSFFSLVMIVLVCLTVFALLIAFVAFALKHMPDQLTNVPADTLTNLPLNMSDATIAITAIIGFVLLIGLSAIMQVVQLKFTLGATKGQPVTFHDCLKQGMQRVVPFIGLQLLTAVSVVIGIVIVGLLFASGAFLGPIALVLGAIGILALIYLIIRIITFAPLSFIDSGTTSPIAAYRQSWRLTNGHLVETVGMLAVAALFAILVELVAELLILATNGSILVLLTGLLALAVVAVMSIVVLAMMAARYHYLSSAQSQPTGPTDATNYIAIVLLLVILPIAGMLSRELTPSQSQMPLTPKLRPYNNPYLPAGPETNPSNPSVPTYDQGQPGTQNY